MESIKFCRNSLLYGNIIEKPDQQEIRSTPALYGADLKTAALYGGELTRQALSAMNFKGDKRHIIVDTKVHMLMKGFMPAIPGWHTDAAPRGDNYSPQGPNSPDIWAQEGAESPRFHLLVTGECRTDFLTTSVDLELPKTFDLYAEMSRQVNKLVSLKQVETETIPSCQVVEWDWWNIHTAVPASKPEWRFLIRVTETDYQQPNTNLSDILRTQQQVYVPKEFGW